MQLHTRLPANISDLNMISTLTGPPVLVEIIHRNNISTRTFQLDQIREAYKSASRLVLQKLAKTPCVSVSPKMKITFIVTLFVVVMPRVKVQDLQI